MSYTYLDFQKAFDKLPHSFLINKLHFYKFHCNIINWIAEFLSNRSQFVVVNGFSSEILPVSSGVPQGTIQAPTLFVLFLNDMFTLPISAELSAYADDVKLYGIVNASDNLAADLARVLSWCDSNSMYVNVSKCGVIHFGRNNPVNKYSIANSQIPSSDRYKDLGIIVDSQLSFKYHTAELVKKSFLMSKCILRSFSKRDPQLLSKLFKTYVLSKILYGAPFFPHTVDSLNRLENIQRKFAKFALLSVDRLDYPTRLALLALQPLELVFLKTGLLHIYKCLHAKTRNISSLPPLISSRTRNSSLKFLPSLCKSVLCHSQFPWNVFSIWNSLPSSVLSAISLSSFRHGLDSCDLSSHLKGRRSKTL